MTLHRAPLLLIVALTACSDRDAPRPVNDLGSPPPAVAARPVAPPPVAATADPNDPGEPGISDLARLARYVFRTMQQHEEVCPLVNPFRDGLHFAFAIEVARGRMTRVGLAEVALESQLGRLSLLKRQWPPELVAYVSCLGPHLKAVEMTPSPADGAYQPFYSFAGRPDGKPVP